MIQAGIHVFKKFTRLRNSLVHGVLFIGGQPQVNKVN